MNLATILATLSLASSMAVSSTPVERQLFSISPRDFAQQFNAVATESGSGLKLPDFHIKPGWHRANTSSGISVLVRAAETGYALQEVVVVCRAVEQCLMTICTTALALDASADAVLLQHFIAARITTEIGNVGLVMSGIVYLVITPKAEDYVALVIRPYLPQQELTARTQAHVIRIAEPAS